MAPSAKTAFRIVIRFFWNLRFALFVIPFISTCSSDVRHLSSTETVQGVYITFYGYDDNNGGDGHLGSAVISDPFLHPIATEDVGDFDHPSTFATDYRIAPPGTRIYVPRLRKYYIMEDTCYECSIDKIKSHRTRVDLYIGGNTGLEGSALENCENDLTASPYTDRIIINPARNLPVDTHPLFRGGHCYIHPYTN